MFNKIINKYQEVGFLGLFEAIINFSLTILFGLKIVKAGSITRNRRALSIFKKRFLKKSDEGYHYLDPMPSENELDIYYSNIYWDSRSGKDFGASSRDFVHYHLLNKYAKNIFIDKNKCIVNFGAGHGGISNIFWFDGFDVVNIEPSGLPQFYNERWKTYKSINEVPDKSVDFIYGSHSLEHVQDIHKFKKEVTRILKPNSLLFWEVPNAKNPNNGPIKNRIDIPHTYYFNTSFFENWFDEIFLNNSYNESHHIDINTIQNWEKYHDDDGSVIRSLGKIF